MKRASSFKNYTWKYINKLIGDNQDTIIENILLPRTKYWDLPGIKILITASNKLRRQRLIKRDNITLKNVKIRDKSGIRYKNKDFYFIVKNDYNISHLECFADQVVNFLNN